MKTIVLVGLVLLSAFTSASANSVIMVDITTTPSAVTYSLNNQPMTASKLAEWMKNAIEQFGDKEPILIQPDSQTTFATVFTLLESLKAAGVKHFEVIATRANKTRGSLTTTAEQVKRNEIPSEPPKPE